MPAITPVQTMITIAQNLLRQTSVQNTQEFGAEQWLVYASMAAREVQRQLSLCNRNFFYDTIQFDMTQGTRLYDLNTITTRSIRKLIRLQRVDRSRPYTVRRIQGGWPAFEHYEAMYPNPSIDPGLQRAMLNGNKLWIAPTPSSTVEDAFEATYEMMIVPQGGFTDAADDDLDPMPDEWVDFGGWWLAYLATQQDEETGAGFKATAMTMLSSLRSDAMHEFKGEPRLAVPLDDDEGY